MSKQTWVQGAKKEEMPMIVQKNGDVLIKFIRPVKFGKIESHKEK